jgi:hypothetical protein
MTGTTDEAMLTREHRRQREVDAEDLRNCRYDADLEMFVEPPHETDLARLTFLRWLVGRGRFEHGPAGAPSGELAALAVSADRCADVLRAA